MSSTDTPPAAEVARTLQLAGSPRRRWTMRLAAALVVVAILTIALIIARRREGAASAVRFDTGLVSRGDLVVTISATGTLTPVNEVEVGSEVSGTIKTVDVDYNDKVAVGQVLARIETSKLAAQLLQSEAALEAAQAKALEAEATLTEAAAQLTRLQQVRQLSGGKVPSQYEYGAQEAAVARARANLSSAQAEVSRARATLSVNQSDLKKAVIYSPVNGVVLSRQIEPGQTVAASFESPVLFRLAEDLTRLELQVDVDEADVGQVRQGQQATFTVDAYPDKRFPAAVTQVRYSSKTTEGVVTYTTVLKVMNEDLALRPGMTATAVITTNQVEDALLVPVAALRFEPPQPAEAAEPAQGRGLVGSLLPGPPGRSTRNGTNGSNGSNGTHRPGREQQLYRLLDGQAVAVPVTTGLSDGTSTEVTAGELEPGMQVITAMASGQG
jgi:HlyD family secretion protein